MQMHCNQIHPEIPRHFDKIFCRYQMLFDLDLAAVRTNSANGSFRSVGLFLREIPNRYKTRMKTSKSWQYERYQDSRNYIRILKAL